MGEKTRTRTRDVTIGIIIGIIFGSVSVITIISLSGGLTNLQTIQPAQNISKPSSTAIPPNNVVTPSTNVATPPNFQLLNGSSLKISDNAPMWVFYETETKEYIWDRNNMPELDVTLYGIIRTTLNQKVETTLTGPINDTVYPARTTDKPIVSALSKTEFPKVSSFKQIIVMDKKQWPLDGTYMLQATHGGIKSWPIFFKVKHNLT